MHDCDDFYPIVTDAVYDAISALFGIFLSHPQRDDTSMGFFLFGKSHHSGLPKSVPQAQAVGLYRMRLRRQPLQVLLGETSMIS
jgi:hypothetical protein